jgi:predicted esterase
MLLIYGVHYTIRNFMKIAFLLALSATFGNLFASTQAPNLFYLGPVKQIKTAIFHTWKPDNVKAVFVITPGFGENPNNTDLLELNEWKKYAFAHSMGLMLVDFSSTAIPPQGKDQNLVSIDGVSDVIKEGIAQEFKDNLPVFFYGRNDQSTQYVLSMISLAPDSLLGWCCNGPEFLKYCPHLPAGMPPGIVSCTTDSIRYDDAQKFFSLGRKNQNKWAWVSSQSSNSAKLRDFIGKYFLSLMNSPVGQWRNANTNEIVESNVADSDPIDTAWLPDSEIGNKWAELQTSRPDKPLVIEKDVDLSGHQLPNIQLYLKIPNGAKDASGVDGVMAYCTWTRERDTLVQQLSNDVDQPPEKIELPSVQMLRFASKHNLAVLTWSTPGDWDTGGNGDEIKGKAKLEVDRQFDLFAAGWEQGVSELCHDYKLPEDKYLLFGMSRGAQWAHRLLLRNPKRFLAINIHVSGSYDEPTEGGKKCLWLVTSGEADPGLPHSKQFYAGCQKMGYSILFKAPEGLGHEMRPDVDSLRNAFFEYALSIKNQSESPTDLSSIISLQNAKYVGDLVSQKVVPADKADQINLENQVYLPTDALADAWQIPPPLDLLEPTTSNSASVPTTVSKEIPLSSTPSIKTADGATPVALVPGVQDTSNSSASIDSTKVKSATVNASTKIETITPNGGHASMPLDIGAKLTIISINADGTVTAVSEFHFKGQVPQSCITIDKP